MAGLPRLPYIVVQKANKATQRHRSSSLSSNTSEDDYHSCQSSPSISRDSSPVREQGDSVRLKDVISSDGGFSYIFTNGGEVKRQVYLFPTKVGTSKQRCDCVKELLGNLYNFNGEDSKTNVDKVLSKLAPDKECKKPHMAKSNQAKMF